MIDFKEKARITKETNEIMEHIKNAEYDNFGKYNVVTNEVQDIEVAKLIIKRLIDKIEELRDN